MSGEARRSVAIFLLSAAIMVLEIALTRVFSFITYHHMTYLVIGVAMLGFGAAGTFLAVRPGPPGDSLGAVDARVALHAVLFGAATLVSLVLLPKVPFHSMNLYWIGDAWNIAALFVLTALAMVPFFFGGVCVAALISDAGASVNRLYFADLAGSAAGSVLSILLVNHAGAVAACVVAAGAGVLVSAVVTERARGLRTGAAVALFALAPLAESPRVLPLHVPPGKQLHGAEDRVETTEWHAITRLDVGAPMDCSCSFGGSLSRTYSGPAPKVRLVFQDGSNLTGIVHPTPTPRETPVLGYFIQGAPYVIRPGAEGLVIGSGGGIDVAIALHHGAKHVVAVDVNPKTMALVRGKYGDFAGHVFDRPDVEPVVSEGRHFLGRDPRRFDVIQLSGVDTWAAQAAGAYALTENFIYTSEAFDQYLAHLRPDGLLGLSRPYVDPPLETLRLIATAVAALERAGAAEPGLHVLVLAGHGLMSEVPWAELLVKRSPFTPEESASLGAWAARLGFEVAYDPYGAGGGALDGLARGSAEKRERLMATYPLDIRPVTDDAPFYFQNHRWKDLLGEPVPGVPPPAAMWILAGSLVELVFLSAVLILYPLHRSRGRGKRRGGHAGPFLFFASLGLGFILVEVALLQKLSVFLGGPAYSLSITLSALLLSSGLGSFASQGAARRPAVLLSRAMPALALVVGAEAFLLDVAIQHLLGLSLAGRALAAVALVAPMGFLMGMPFPAGLRLLEESRPDLKPWAWGINACATVVGSTACMCLVSSAGFRAAILAGSATYLAGWAALEASRRSAASPAEPAEGPA